MCILSKISCKAYLGGAAILDCSPSMLDNLLFLTEKIEGGHGCPSMNLDCCAVGHLSGVGMWLCNIGRVPSRDHGIWCNSFFLVYLALLATWLHLFDWFTKGNWTNLVILVKYLSLRC